MNSCVLFMYFKKNLYVVYSNTRNVTILYLKYHGNYVIKIAKDLLNNRKKSVSKYGLLYNEKNEKALKQIFFQINIHCMQNQSKKQS